jgi:phosphate transport system substrate-binding protein
VDFGSSDKPLPSEELAEAGLGQFPSAIGGVVPVVNIEGIEAGELRLTGELLAKIFMGEITNWNDPAIAAVNEGLQLPDKKISVVHRSDGSGTTFNFVNYLSKVSPEWKDGIGEGTSVSWPTGVGGKGNEGVAAYVKQIDGGIGYVELAYATETGMAYTAMQNAAGNWVQPSIETFQAAAATADWANAKDFSLVITNAPGEQAWPLTATNFILMYKQPKDPQRSQDAMDFFTWALENGQPQAQELHYVPLPPELVAQVKEYWAAEFKL